MTRQIAQRAPFLARKGSRFRVISLLPTVTIESASLWVVFVTALALVLVH